MVPEGTGEDDRQPLPHRLEGAVEMQDSPIGVVVVLDELKRDDLTLREETLEEADGVLICPGGAVAVEVCRQVAPEEDPSVSEYRHIAPLHRDVVWSRHYLIRIDLRPDGIVRLHLLLSVGDDIGTNKRVPDDEAYISRKDLLHTPVPPGTKDGHTLPLHKGDKRLYLTIEILIQGILVVQDGVVRLSVVGLGQCRRFAVMKCHTGHHSVQLPDLV